jgi:hypothetical protein
MSDAAQSAAHEALMASFAAPEPGPVDGMGDPIAQPGADPAAAPAAVAVDAPPITHGALMDALDGRAPENVPDPQPGTDPNPAPAAPQTQAERRRLAAADFANADIEMVIDGKTVVVTGEQFLRERQRQESANKRYAEAAAKRAEAEAMIEAMSSALDDPDRLRAELIRSGRNPAEIAKALFEREQLEASLTPEQRRIRDLEAEVRRTQEAEAARQQQFVEHQTRQAQEVYLRDFNAVIDESAVPPNAALRGVLVKMLADATFAAETNEGRRFTKREARELVKSVTAHYERPAPTLTVEQRRAMITAEDVAAWHEAQKAAKAQAAPQLARNPNDVLGTPRTTDGKFAPQKPRPAAGGRVVMNPGEAFRDKF